MGTSIPDQARVQEFRFGLPAVNPNTDSNIEKWLAAMESCRFIAMAFTSDHSVGLFSVLMARRTNILSRYSLVDVVVWRNGDEMAQVRWALDVPRPSPRTA